jgi:hypothetical protein
MRYQSCHELLTALKNYHDMSNPDATMRVTPALSQAANHAPGRPVAQAPRNSAVPAIPATAVPTEPAQPVRFMLPVYTEEESSKKPGGILLTAILLGIIGYAGYRVYPPLLDLWQRAHAAEATPAPAKPEAAAPPTATAPAAEGSSEVKPETAPNNAAQLPASASAPAVAGPADNALPAPAAATGAAPATAPAPAPSPTTNAFEAAVAAANERANAQQKPVAPATPPAPSAARFVETKLRKELAGQPIADKVTTHVNGNALTLSGSLSLAEHRELLAHLRNVPASVHVIDDTEEGAK